MASETGYGDAAAPRVAIVHDWLVGNAGGERVLSRLLALYPGADIFSMVEYLPDAHKSLVEGHRVTTSFIQRLPRAKRWYRGYLPFMPIAVEQFDLSAYDIVISSTHAVAKGVITGPDQLHVAYCHSPIRYAWDLQHRYLAEARLTRGIKSMVTRLILHYVRLWDVRTANGVDAFVANSRYIARRIRKVYGRESTVIHPPVDVEGFTPGMTKEDFYVTASRMVPYKRIPLIVEAFAAMPTRRLVVIGDGPEFASAKAKAGPNVTFLGYQPFSVLRDHLQRARAFVFAAEEDFGILPVEAQACGTPVIGYGRGGLLETVIPPRGDDASAASGILYDEQTPDAIRDAVDRFERYAFDPAAVRASAERFASDHFDRAFGAFVAARYARHREEIVGASPVPEETTARR